MIRAGKRDPLHQVEVGVGLEDRLDGSGSGATTGRLARAPDWPTPGCRIWIYSSRRNGCSDAPNGTCAGAAAA